MVLQSFHRMEVPVLNYWFNYFKKEVFELPRRGKLSPMVLPVITLFVSQTNHQVPGNFLE